MTADLANAVGALLTKWERSEMSVQHIHEEAEELFEAHFKNIEDTEPDSILMEILSQLDVLNHQLITQADVPALREFLEERTNPSVAWRNYLSYMDNVDWNQRKQQLRGHGYYNA